MQNLEFKGKLGKDPELKESKAGKPYCTFSVYISKKDKRTDEWETTWFNCITFGENAEYVAGAFKKKDEIHVTRSEVGLNEWTNSEGKTYASLNVMVWEIGSEELPVTERGEPEGDEDDIPF